MRKIAELIEDLKRLDPDTWTDIVHVASVVDVAKRKLVLTTSKPQPLNLKQSHD